MVWYGLVWEGGFDTRSVSTPLVDSLCYAGCLGRCNDVYDRARCAIVFMQELRLCRTHKTALGVAND